MDLPFKAPPKPQCLGLTGLSGAGKSTLAELMIERLRQEKIAGYIIDGDRLRQGISRDLGFQDADRVENMRRAAEIARMMVDAGVIAIVSMISPFRADRDSARQRFAAGEFTEVHIDTPIDICIKRDPKGLYAKALRGDIAQFTGIDSAYEAPEQPELRISTAERAPQHCVDEIIAFLNAQTSG